MTTRQIIETLIRPALAHPEYLRVVESKAGTISVYRVSVHGADYGRVCGRGGRNLAALNAIMEPIDEGARVILETPLTDDRQVNAVMNPRWTPDAVIEMLRAWARAAAVPGEIAISESPRSGNIYDIVFAEPIPPEVLNSLAKWASVVAQGRGGKVCISGAAYSTFE